MKTTRILMASAALALSAWPAPAATYEIDPVHSQVGFKIRHMMAGKTAGHFNAFSGLLEYDGKDPKKWSVQSTIDAASIDTGNSKRDGHLRSPDFFDVAKFPSLSFVSSGVTGWKDGKGKLRGKLTIHGVTKDVALDLEGGGDAADRVGFTASVKIDRRDYGVLWNKALDRGGVVVGNDVEIVLEIEAVRKT